VSTSSQDEAVAVVLAFFFKRFPDFDRIKIFSSSVSTSSQDEAAAVVSSSLPSSLPTSPSQSLLIAGAFAL
jgi:hypothetical protein